MIITNLKKLIDDDIIDAPYSAIQPSSIDVCIGDTIMYEDTSKERIIILRKDKIKTEMCLAEGFGLKPNEFILTKLKEKIHLPNNITALFYLDSCLARSGLEHSASILMHPDWEGYLTLELKNVSRAHTLIFTKNMQIGKIIFHQHEETSSYQGQYQNQTNIN